MLSILLYLQNEGKLSARELADRLEVSERTIMRDMESLSMSGIPVYAERGSSGGWLLAEGYRMKLTGMKAEELIALIIATHPGLLADLGIEQHFNLALQKLLASTPSSIKQNAEQLQRKIHIDGASWHKAQESCPYLNIIQEATLSERKLCIHYNKEGQPPSVRNIHPLGLVAKRSVWYVVGQSAEGLRTYRVSRIAYATLLEDTFEYPVDFVLDQYWEQSKAEFKHALPHYVVCVRMNEAALRRIEQERYVHILELKNHSNGSLEAMIDCATLEYGCSLLLGLGASVEVLSPPELRAKMISEAQAILNCYSSKN